MKVRIILFDIGNTLINSFALMKGALKCSAKKLKELKFIKNQREFVNAYLEADKNTIFEHINHVYSDIEIIKKAWRSLGYEDDYKAYANFLFEYRNYVRSNIRSDSRILKIAERLKNKKILLGIVSDGTTVEQLDTLVRLGLISYLQADLVFLSEDIGVEKTNSSFYEHILNKVSNQNREMIVVGDRLEADISIPKQLGFKTVLFLKYVKYPIEKIKAASPDFIIKDISEIERIVDLI